MEGEAAEVGELLLLQEWLTKVRLTMCRSLAVEGAEEVVVVELARPLRRPYDSD